VSAVIPPADIVVPEASVRTSPPQGHGAVLAVFTVSVFTSAFLLFLVQPLFGRMVLPRLGGSPAVWNACMLFFQAALLAGYLYAHVSSRLLRPRLQMGVHLGLMATAALALPIALGARVPDADTAPVLWLLGVMAATVGPPFAVLAGTGPLLQRWFAHSRHRHAADPYPLYAASNLGSALALFAYPALMEPRLRLAEQSGVWAMGYGVLAALVVCCALVLGRVTETVEASAADVAETPALGAWERARWVGLAFLPSSMLLGVTAYLTTDLVPMPLLWVLPLGLYLLSFTMVFARRPLLPHAAMLRAQPALLGIVALMLVEGLVRRPMLAIALHLVCLFVTAMVCHGELARRRPPVRYLTEFYLWIAVGGVLGGVFNVIVAPQLFNRLWEYPLVVVLACLARPWPRSMRFRAQLAPAALAAVVSVALVWTARQESGITTIPTIIVAAAAIHLSTMYLASAPLWLAVAFGAFLGARSVNNMRQEGTILATRSFFGAYRVARIETASGTYHTLTHGSTLHGAQARDVARRRDPFTYYLREGPVGQIFAALRAPASRRRVAFVGLGTGTAAAYGSRGDQWTYYEIDPGIERIARDTAYFTFLEDSPAQMDVVLGDARLRMAEAPPAGFDLIALDAFTSDAVPTHLLTVEALDMYLQKLAPGGLITYHVSNRYLDLESVVHALARARGMVAWVGEGPVNRPGRYDQFSTWVVVGRRAEDLGPLTADSRWSEMKGPAKVPLWTDDYSSVLSVMAW
jgi:hypothetical protein